MEACDSEIADPHGQAKDSVDGVKKGPMESGGRLVYVRRRVEVVETAKATKEPSPEGHRLEWEERYQHLQMLLNKLNDSDQKDHVQSKSPPLNKI